MHKKLTFPPRSKKPVAIITIQLDLDRVKALCEQDKAAMIGYLNECQGAFFEWRSVIEKVIIQNGFNDRPAPSQYHFKDYDSSCKP